MNGELSGGTNGLIYEKGLSVRKDTVWKVREPVPMNFSTGDMVFALVMLLCGFFYWNLISIVDMGAGVTLFALIFCSATMSYLKYSNIHQTRQSLLCLGIIVLSALNFSLLDSIFIKGLNFIFLSLSVIYWICLSTGRRLENKLSIYILSDMYNQLFVIPFYNFTCCFGGARQLFVRNQKGKGLFSGVVGIVIFLPVLILVISLLTDADAAFESLIERMQFSFSGSMLEYIKQLVLGLPVACYLYGLIYGNRYERNTGLITLETVNKNMKAFRFAPDATVYSALTALNLVYGMFFLSQVAYFFSAFGNSLPETMTYAEYARRGFFELCTVSGINLAVITLAHVIVKRDQIKILKFETAALCLFTMMLIATAISKMGMYIDFYGLTRMRAYTCWFMLLLFLVFVIVLLRQFKSFNGTRIALISFICFFMFLCYGNVDGMIAKYNIDGYQRGTLESLDVSALSELSDGAVPYLYELYQETGDEALRGEIRQAILSKPSLNDLFDSKHESFRDLNLQRYRADQIRKVI